MKNFFDSVSCICFESLLHASENSLLACSSAPSLQPGNVNDETKALEAIKRRVRKQEDDIFYHSKSQRRTESNIHEEVTRAYKSIALRHNIFSSVFKWVPENYYSLTLAERAKLLGSPSTWQLCKSMLMENKAFDNALAEDGSYRQFYLVVLQYETTISTKKLISEIRALKKPVIERYDANKFDFRVASSEDNAKLTGYSHNAVSPFGLLDSKSVTIILSKSICDMMKVTKTSPFIWMGGGHIHCKVGMATTDFINALNPLILDVAEPKK